tara:strand:+ start:98 stop:751 length:654 start_codon:yes stop_codon:yes gene_type:complete
MKNLNFIKFFFIFCLLTFIGSTNNPVFSQESTSFKSAGKWLVGLKVLNLDPDVDSTVSIGGGAVVDDDTVPELDIRYFITDTIAIEAIFGTTEHKVSAKNTALGDVNLGTIKVLPPTFTLQYHFKTESKFKPYVGAGINYTFFYDGNPGQFESVKYKDEIGIALNIGFDFILSDNNFFNIDIKKYDLPTDVNINNGVATADVDLDPLAISIGYGWRF